MFYRLRKNWKNKYFYEKTKFMGEIKKMLNTLKRKRTKRLAAASPNRYKNILIEALIKPLTQTKTNLVRPWHLQAGSLVFFSMKSNACDWSSEMSKSCTCSYFSSFLTPSYTQKFLSPSLIRICQTSVAQHKLNLSRKFATFTHPCRQNVKLLSGSTVVLWCNYLNMKISGHPHFFSLYSLF